MGHAREDATTGQSRALGSEGWGRGWSEISGYFKTGHEGVAEADAACGSKPVETLSATHRRMIPTLGRHGIDPAAPDDFAAVLRRRGLYPAEVSRSGSGGGAVLAQTEATTILAFKFAEGVLVAGDRRATAGNVVVYDRADKVLEIDRHSLMAIAGVPATAWEMARVLEHSFQYYRRTQLQEMSLDGKVRALSKLLRDNFSWVMQGVGIVVPIFATFDLRAKVPRLYFYDAMGAQFEAADFAASGSGSPGVKSVLFYANRWGEKPLRELDRESAIVTALRALETAAVSDTATGGMDRRSEAYPAVKIVGETGITSVAENDLGEIYRSRLS